MLELNEMAVFAHVAEYGSFTKAAEKLNMPKSTISRHISQLEASLGVRLLNRTTRKLKLTEIGRHYFGHCQRMVEEAEQARSVVLKMQAEPSGQLRMSMPLSFGSPFIQDVIQEFLALYPKVSMELLLENRKLDLLEDDIDIAFRVSGDMADSTMIARNVGAARLVFCATPKYIEQHGIPSNPNELLKHKVIRHMNAPIILKNGNDQIELTPPCRLAINDMMLIREMTLRHMGIGVMPAMIANNELINGDLVLILPDSPFFDKSIYLVYPSRRQQASKVIAFVDFVMQKLKPGAPWEEAVKRL